MTAGQIRYQLVHAFVTRQIGHPAYRRLVDLLDSGSPAREVERELADEVARDGRDR